MVKVSLKQVCKAYTAAIAEVDDFTLDIQDGAFVVMAGPTGCGKSTILRMIAGLEQLTSGEIYIDGKSVGDISPENREVAMILQDNVLYPQMTVAENLAYRLRMRKLHKEEIEPLVQNAADALGISEFMKLKPEELSDIEQQRVALARAVVGSPKLLLIDEWMVNFESGLKKQLRIELTKLHAKLGITTIYATNDQAEVTALDAQTVVIKNGLVQQIGQPEELYNAPANLFVADFIGQPRMNIMSVAVAGGELILGEDRLPIGDKRAGEQVIMGIRPEHLHDQSEDSSQTCGTLHVLVEHSETTETGNYLHVNCAGKQLVAKVANDCSARAGDQIELYIALCDIYLFHKDTEQAI